MSLAKQELMDNLIASHFVKHKELEVSFYSLIQHI